VKKQEPGAGGSGRRQKQTAGAGGRGRRQKAFTICHWTFEICHWRVHVVMCDFVDDFFVTKKNDPQKNDPQKNDPRTHTNNHELFKKSIMTNLKCPMTNDKSCFCLALPPAPASCLLLLPPAPATCSCLLPSAPPYEVARFL
jgi:hypothetical protein